VLAALTRQARKSPLPPECRAIVSTGLSAAASELNRNSAVSPSSWYMTFMANGGVEVGSHKPGPTKYTGPPMDLANMRMNGVRSLSVSCLDCHRSATVNVDDRPGHLAVPSFSKRLRRTQCQNRRVHVMPAWHTRPLKFTTHETG
jgi:hypothetical protein